MPFALFNASTTWSAPANMQAGSLQCYCWGESGNGGSSAHGVRSGGGPGGGAFGGEPALGGVTPGSTTLTITVGTGGTGTDTSVTGGSVTVSAAHGTSASNATPGTGGAAGSNTIAFKGGDGATGINGATTNGAGGGGSAGSTGAGGNASTSAGGAAGTGGTAGGQSLAGVAGQNGAGTSSAGAAGVIPGGGASGGGSVGAINNPGGAGAAGQVLLVWTTVTVSPVGYAAVTASVAGSKNVSGAVKGYLSFTGAPLPVSVINQWTGTFAQPAAFGITPPALQSTVIALTPSASTGLGTGVPTAGNWLVCITGMTEQAAGSGFTVGDADDIHSFWRPGDVTVSNWAVSTAAGKTRTSVWYTPNLARAPGDVYIAPNGCMAGMACTVLEVAGLSPWDVVTGIATNYAAAATTLNLALGVPSGPAFVIAAACGDSTAAGQALAPGSPWQVLTTVSATDGSDHLCDAVLTTACLSTTSGSVSVNATASSATDLSGVIIGFQVSAASPIPAGANPAWPGRVILEAAFGSGYETPADQMTWTTLNDNAAPRTLSNQRFWSWRDSGGVPYALGQLQSSEGEVQLDNSDGALCPSTSVSGTSSPYYPDVTTGTPIRLRCAIGTIPASNDTPAAVVNRWYVIQKNTLAWPEKRNKIFRDFVDVTLSDIWSVLSGAPPTPFRGEVEQDMQGVTAWWWPMDDQPLTGGVLPSSLRNAAPGNSIPLNIVLSPNGGQVQPAYLVTGSQAVVSSGTPGSIATYQVAASQGWMYGDPQSGQQSAQSGNSVTASPGSAAWQVTGQAGNTGSYGWFLAVNDPAFPALNGPGATIEKWFQYPFFGTGTVANPALGGSSASVASQPYCPLTILELATGSNPVAIVQLDTSGHLSLITYSGSTPTSHSIWSGSDLRSGTWHQVVAVLTSTTWLIYLDGGLLATVSGSAAGMSNFTWLIGNGDFGSNGGSSAGTGLVHGGNVSLSHLIVYPGLLPAWRVRAHYCAAIMGFGALPAPTSPAVQWITSGCTPDGSQTWTGAGGYLVTAGSESMSAVVTAVAGPITSGPSAWAVGNGFGSHMFAWVGFAGLAPEFNVYMQSALGSEAQASVVAGAGEAYTGGFGGSATGAGFCHVSGGSGASPPVSGTAAGDTVASRWERILGYTGVTAPSRATDYTANALVKAALDIGGQAGGSSLQNLVDSDNGLPGVDNNNTLYYRSRPHLAADTVVWLIGMNVISGMVPFLEDISWSSDPQQIWDDITVAQYSPDGATLPVIVPSNAAAVNAAQKQFGPRPKPVTSYLQDASKIQSAANWWFSTFGVLRRRASVISIDAAQHPSAWPLVLGVNGGDIVQVYDAPFNGQSTTGTYRVSHWDRSVSFGANGAKLEGRVSLVVDPLPASYWS